MATTVDLTGSWKLDRSEKFNEFLELMGENENFMVRQMMKIARFAKPVQTIKLEDGKFHIETKSVVKTTIQEFKIDEEFEREEQGHKLKGKAEWEGDKLVVNQAPSDPESKLRKQKIVREIKDGELVMTISVGDDDCICTRIFKKIEVQPATPAVETEKKNDAKEEEKPNDETPSQQ